MFNVTNCSNVFMIDNGYTIKLLRKASYLWVATNALVLLPISTFMLDFETRIQNSKTAASELIIWLNRVWHSHFNVVGVILVLLILFCALDIFVKETRLNSVVIFGLFYIVENICISMWDGGVNLMHLILIYLVFLSSSEKKLSPRYDDVKVMTNNCVLYMTRIQIALVYLCAGLMKIHGDLWGKGIALYYTLNIEQYSHPFLVHVAQKFPLITVVGNYVTLLFQLSFPFLIWFHGTRKPMLFLGTLLHLGIAFGMGLFGFGFAMCVSYFAFYSNEKAKAVFNALEQFRNNLLSYFHLSRRGDLSL